VKRCDELGPVSIACIPVTEVAKLISAPDVKRTSIGHGTRFLRACRDGPHTFAEESRDHFRDLKV
jgi:hypothetical protein